MTGGLRGLLGAALVVGLAAVAWAHDQWLVPPATVVAVGEPARVEVSVGMDFPTSLLSIEPERLTASARGPEGRTRPVSFQRDEAGATTWAGFTPDRAGTWLVEAVTRPRLLAQEAAAFNDYLLHDGLPHVLAGRMDRGELERDVVERYSKSVKALVVAGDGGPGDAFGQRLGHTLEIVPLSDPLAAGVGETLAVQVLFRGEPLERANLCWDHPGNGEDFTGQSWTDGQGRVLVPIVRRGPMTLRLVHMTRPQTEDYEWESFWASYTFHVR